MQWKPTKIERSNPMLQVLRIEPSHVAGTCPPLNLTFLSKNYYDYKETRTSVDSEDLAAAESDREMNPEDLRPADWTVGGEEESSTVLGAWRHDRATLAFLHLLLLPIGID